MDIDCFKQINDRLGHECGDDALKQVAALITAGKRSSDIVARIGGDEFAALLPETDARQAQLVAERVRQSIAEHRGFGNGIDAITVSTGVAAAALSMSGIGALMLRADKALYEAKAAGRNCTRCFEEPGPREYRAAAE